MHFAKEPPTHLLTGDHVQAEGDLSDNVLLLYTGSNVKSGSNKGNSGSTSTGTSTPTGPVPYTFGPQATLVMLVTFQDDPVQPFTVSDVQTLVLQALQDKPLIVVTDLVAGSADVCAVIRELKRNPETRHIPVIAFTDLKNEELQSAATTAGATMVAGNDAILDQLPELLEQALQVE